MRNTIKKKSKKPKRSITFRNKVFIRCRIGVESESCFKSRRNRIVAIYVSNRKTIRIKH